MTLIDTEKAKKVIAAAIWEKICVDIAPPWRATPGSQYYQECAQLVRDLDLSAHAVKVPANVKSRLYAYRQSLEKGGALCAKADYSGDAKTLLEIPDFLESLAAQVAEKDSRIVELANHLKQSIAFITHTAAFGKQAARGILQAGNDESTRFFVEDARKLIEDRADD